MVQANKIPRGPLFVPRSVRVQRTVEQSGHAKKTSETSAVSLDTHVTKMRVPAPASSSLPEEKENDPVCVVFIHLCIERQLIANPGLWQVR